MTLKRDWKVLLIGGASGTGKSRLATELGSLFNMNVLEVDDFCQGVKAITSSATHPALHYWNSGIDWREIGVEGNVEWLKSVGKEISKAMDAIIKNHVASDAPIIIEGDFIHPDLCHWINHPDVELIYVFESEEEQIIQNYSAREGGAIQSYRASISVAFGEWLKAECIRREIPVISSRPWDNQTLRVLDLLSKTTKK